MQAEGLARQSKGPHGSMKSRRDTTDVAAGCTTDINEYQEGYRTILVNYDSHILATTT